MESKISAGTRDFHDWRRGGSGAPKIFSPCPFSLHWYQSGLIRRHRRCRCRRQARSPPPAPGPPAFATDADAGTSRGPCAAAVSIFRRSCAAVAVGPARSHRAAALPAARSANRHRTRLPPRRCRAAVALPPPPPGSAAATDAVAAVESPSDPPAATADTGPACRRRRRRGRTSPPPPSPAPPPLPFPFSVRSAGADVNQRLFRGFATTAAAREGRTDLVELLLKAGASQPACEEALLEACCHGRANLVELLMGSDLVRHQIAVHALVLSCCRGFVDVVDALMKCGVDANATDRVLLRSLKPSLHTNVDCTPLVAAVVSRQKAVVRQLLQAGVKRNTKERLGGWSWDPDTGEEFRVGAGLSEPYGVAWCAVEYFESTGTILRMLLQHLPSDALHNGRALLHHAILCANPGAVDVLLDAGVDVELPVKTNSCVAFRPIHLAARLGLPVILQRLVNAGCDLNSRTDSGETALMVCARYKRDECLRVLAAAGADFGLISSSGLSAASIASSSQWSVGFQQSMLAVIHSGTTLCSNDRLVFSPLMFVSRTGDVRALQALMAQSEVNIDAQDEDGYTPVMITAKEGHVEAFRCLVFAGADVKICNKSGETAITLSQLNKEKRDLFEKVMLEFALETGIAGGFYALHCAARRGDLAAVRLLATRGYDVNIPDEDGYTPLMLAAKEGHGPMCELLISSGARCDVTTHRGETALKLARLNGAAGSHAEQVLLDELSRVLVLGGASVKKHTKCGKGSPHGKAMRMVAGAGVLRWGQSSRRNVVCSEADVGPSSSFLRHRRGKADAFEAGIFRVVTTKGREIHFVCDGGDETARLWVRGIKLVTREAFRKFGTV